MKKETIEEAAEIAFSYEYGGEETSVTDRKREAFIRGAKWQQERSYSQLDVVKILSKYETLSNEDFNKWFEQFKK